MALGIRVLDVEQHEVGCAKQRVEALRRIGRIRVPAGIKTGVHPSGRTGAGLAEEGGHELGLEQRLPTRNRDAAVAIKLPIALERAHDVLNRNRCARLKRPGIGVVAVCATHRASLDEHYKTCARSIDRAHGLDGMNAPQRELRLVFYLRLELNLCHRAHAPCSRCLSATAIVRPSSASGAHGTTGEVSAEER